ncbi:MAG TPA: response regulator transcription factor [Nitrospira sp.]|nr:response regulator transcription factor [Nitrospira sp.]
MKQALVVDDHPIVRDGVKELLQRAFPSILIKGSSGADGVLEEVCGYPWAFVVLDINLPGQSGIDILKKARSRCPTVPIVVFSLFSEPQYAARTVRAGAAAYLSKDRSPLDLIDAVKTALRGGPVKEPRDGSMPPLSDRERQVLASLAKGMSGKDISKELNINIKTVSTYKVRILQKLGLRNVVELIRYATEEGLSE